MRGARGGVRSRVRPDGPKGSPPVERFLACEADGEPPVERASLARPKTKPTNQQAALLAVKQDRS